MADHHSEIILTMIKKILHFRSIEDVDISNLLNESYIILEDYGVLVIWSKHHRENLEDINNYSTIIETNEITRVLLIYKHELSVQIQTIIKTWPGIEIFSESELTYDITTHPWVPSYRLIGGWELMSLMKSLGIHRSGFPKVKVSDPLIRLYGYTVGNVLEITPKSRPHEISYRCVIK
jgi:DNA-directed RNA polymerase subunit H (RpoH/RPB5)